MAQLELNGVVQRYGKHTVVDGVDFRLEAGSIACLLGPSGCGKTTLLRCIAGFENIAAGEIRLHGAVVSQAGQSTPPEKRRIGMVFQDYALFPHLTVEQNVAFGLGRKPGQSPKAEANATPKTAPKARPKADAAPAKRKKLGVAFGSADAS